MKFRRIAKFVSKKNEDRITGILIIASMFIGAFLSAFEVVMVFHYTERHLPAITIIIAGLSMVGVLLILYLIVKGIAWLFGYDLFEDKGYKR